jgi:signal transduction histidine kinase
VTVRPGIEPVGAGLGLSIVRAVVTAHNGTVEARNGDPLGAVVTVSSRWADHHKPFPSGNVQAG